MRCKKVSTEAQGIVVKTFSGLNESPICTIGSRSHLDHYISVENLQVHPASVIIHGLITSRPKSVRFSSPDKNDSDSCWNAWTELPDYGRKAFDHVQLLACGRTHENVIVHIKVRWPDPEWQEEANMAIEVTP
jgi:hypothetical protein